MPKVKCKTCDNIFYSKPSHIKLGYGKYCSRKCHHEGARNGMIVNCDTCKKKIYRGQGKLQKSKSKKYFCDKSCQTVWRNGYFSGEKHKNWNGGDSIYRKVLLSKVDILEKCKVCRTEDKRILVGHHIDKNRKNNAIANLTWLCYNCHYLVHRDKVVEKEFMEALV